MWRILGACLLLAWQGCAGTASSSSTSPGTSPGAPASPGTPASAPSASPATGPAAAPGSPAQAGKEPDPLFATRGQGQGWDAVDPDTASRVARFATDYAAYLADAKTPRRAVVGLLAVFRDGATRLEPNSRPGRTPGSRHWFTAPGGDAAALVLVGQEPLEQGVRIIIASVDAPRIDLKQRPVYSSAGLAMFDTVLYGEPELESWLSRPMALSIHVARPGAAHGALDLLIGDGPDDPVLVIPDLLPHLARKVQRNQIVDSPERMDAVAARSTRALIDRLANHGVDERVLAEAETSLVPAGPPTLVGVDRALLAGYGQSHRAFAYAAVRALDEAPAPRHTAVVILISQTEENGRGVSGIGFVKTAMSRVLASLSSKGAELDVLDTRRAYARSAALVTSRLSGALGKGVILCPGSDDAVPGATRRVLDSFAAAGAQVQLSDEDGWSSARVLSILDIDVVDVAIPSKGQGTPMELISTLDLYQAWLAAGVWLTR